MHQSPASAEHFHRPDVTGFKSFIYPKTFCCMSSARLLSMAYSYSSEAVASPLNNFTMLDGCCKDVPKQQLGPQEPYHHASYDRIIADQPGENCQDQSKILCSSLQTTTEPSALAVQDEVVPLLGYPYFTSIISESHIHRDFILKIPSRFIQFLPPSSALVVLHCRSNEWVVKCCVYGHKKQLENGWEKFVVDNKLRIGDGCVFELMNFKESFPLKFKVQILNGQIPSSASAGVAGLPSADCIPTG